MSKELAEKLKVLEGYLSTPSHVAILRDAIAALRSEPEPVGEVTSRGEYALPVFRWLSADHSLRCQIGDKLYAAPSREDRAEPVAGQLSAEQVEAKFEAWLRANCFQRPTQEAYELAKCAWKEMALSSLRGTFADGIEAVLSDAELHLSERQRSRIRALAQGQRSEAEASGTPKLLGAVSRSSDHPTEQDADELLRGAVDDLRAVLCDPEGNASIHGSVGDLAIVEGALQRIDAHLARKEQ